MSTAVFRMPNEGHLGGFEIRRFIQKYTRIGLLISISVHALILGAYQFGAYLASREPPPPSRVIYLDPSNLGPPPSLSPEEIAPALKIAQPRLAAPAATIPKPVTDDVAPDEPQIPTQDQLRDILNTQVDSLAMGGGDQLDIREAPPDEDAIPNPEDFIPYEQEPKLVKRVEPKFPAMAQNAGVGGKVLVQFYVDKKGDVKKALIVKATPPGLGFEEEAVKAVLQWKFTPALQRENPVGVWVAQQIRFEVK
jgi:TonB family protein